ncbi:hypothetical protein GYB59_18630 [bacterium]|nr:hypothetical protein [bacterium]
MTRYLPLSLLFPLLGCEDPAVTQHRKEVIRAQETRDRLKKLGEEMHREYESGSAEGTPSGEEVPVEENSPE